MVRESIYKIVFHIRVSSVLSYCTVEHDAKHEDYIKIIIEKRILILLFLVEFDQTFFKVFRAERIQRWMVASSTGRREM